MMKKLLSKCLLLVAAALMCSSCITRKQINYVQDMGNDSVVALDNAYEAKIHPNDELVIYITCSDRRLSDNFNLTGTYSASGYSSQSNPENQIGYLVDINGDIGIPTIGRIHVDGMTRLELQDTITSILVNGGYLIDPVVLVRFKNYKIFIQNATGAQTITVSNERVTVMQALAQAGSLSAYSRRDRIGVLREEKDGMHLHYLNLKTKDVFKDPYFLLQQNDVVLLEPLTASRIKENLSWMASYTSLVVSIVTLVVTLNNNLIKK